MTDPIVSNAISAYNAATRAIGGSVLETQQQAGPSFGELLQGLKDDAIATGKAEEKQSMLAGAGQANITEVVTAVASAEVTLQAVTAVRDRVISAYQEIMRMPI
jgi:flagellar hook-basal body complex protein FliE